MSPVLFLLATLMAETPAPAKPAGPVKVKLETTKGAIVLELDAAKAPQTVENFVKYVQDGHYDGTVFHRVIPGFMVQGGGFTADMAQKLLEFCKLDRRDRIALRNNVDRRSWDFDWPRLVPSYHAAHDLALHRFAGQAAVGVAGGA